VNVLPHWSPKAWGFPCPGCHDSRGCAECAARRNCRTHAKNLLTSNGWLVTLECRSCGFTWLVDTQDAKSDDQRAAS
jgi:hypothetical protein